MPVQNVHSEGGKVKVEFDVRTAARRRNAGRTAARCKIQRRPLRVEQARVEKKPSVLAAVRADYSDKARPISRRWCGFC